MKWWRFSIIGVFSMAVSLAALDGLGADEPAGSGGSAVSTANSTPDLKPGREDETARVAKLLDSVIQPRFLQDAGEFGVRRLLTLNGHEAVTFHAESKKEQKVLDQVKSSGRDYFIAFLHTAHKPGKYAKGRLGGAPPMPEFKPHLSRVPTDRDSRRTEREQLSSAQWAALLKVAGDDLPRLREGKAAAASFEKWGLTLQPVLAQKSCLDCHAGAKQGETLGVMVYGVEKNAAK